MNLGTPSAGPGTGRGG